MAAHSTSASLAANQERLRILGAVLAALERYIRPWYGAYASGPLIEVFGYRSLAWMGVVGLILTVASGWRQGVPGPAATTPAR